MSEECIYIVIAVFLFMLFIFIVSRCCSSCNDRSSKSNSIKNQVRALSPVPIVKPTIPNVVTTPKPIQIPVSLLNKYTKYSQTKITSDKIKDVKLREAHSKLMIKLNSIKSDYKKLEPYLKDTKPSDPQYYEKVANAIKITNSNIPVPKKIDFSKIFTSKISPTDKRYNKNYLEGLRLNDKFYKTNKCTGQCMSKLAYENRHLPALKSVLNKLDQEYQKEHIRLVEKYNEIIQIPNVITTPPSSTTTKTTPPPSKCTGEMHCGGKCWGRFCGPGGSWAKTKDFEPCDMLDSCCKTHDGAYHQCGGWCKDHATFTGLGGCVWNECYVKADLEACGCFLKSQFSPSSGEGVVFNKLAIVVFCDPLRFILAALVLGVKWFVNLLIDIGGWIAGFIMEMYNDFLDVLSDVFCGGFFDDIFGSVCDGSGSSGNGLDVQDIIKRIEKIMDKVSEKIDIDGKGGSSPTTTTPGGIVISTPSGSTTQIPVGGIPDGSVVTNNCWTTCYQDTLVKKCWQCSPLGCKWNETERTNSPGACCRVQCINGFSKNVCGVDSPQSRSIGNQPVRENPIVGYDCSSGTPVRREATPGQGGIADNGSYCDSHDCSNYQCGAGYHAACSNGEVRPPGCFCARN